MAGPLLKNDKLRVTLKLLALFIAVLIAAFIANAAIIIGINVYYHATIHDAPQAASAIDAALSNVWVTLSILLLQNAAFIFVAWLFLTKVDKVKFSWKELGLNIRKDTPKLILAGFGLNLLFAPPLFGILLLIGATSFIAFGWAAQSPSAVILSLILMGIGTIAVGFGEEIVFRGYLQNMLTKKYGIVWALPIASLIFVAVHLLPKVLSGSVELLYFVSVFPVALILGYLFYATKSLWIGVAFHALEDFMVLQVFSTYNVKSGSAPVFIISEVKNVIVSGVTLGNWGDLMGLIVGSVLFLAIVAYFLYKNRAGQSGPASLDDKANVQ